MGNIAYQLQRSLQWDPEQRRFIGDEAANRLMGRSMRALANLNVLRTVHGP